MAGFSRDIPGERFSQLTLAKIRLGFVACLFILGYLAISLRLADLTLLHDKPQDDMATVEAVKPLAKPLRGTITDRNGDLMATSLAMASVYADATLIDNPAAVAAELGKIIPNANVKDIEKKLASGKKFVWIERNITPKQQYAINTLGHPGLSFQQEDRRIYPHGALTAHLVGYTDVDGHGIAGVERTAEETLAAGEDTVSLTIDLRLQHIMHRELQKSMKYFRAKAATGIVMDVNSGEILSMVSLPDFDPYQPGKAVDDARFNRASLGVYEMGSTFKLFALAGALDSGKAGFSTTFDASEAISIGRFKINDYHAKRRVMTVPEIFIHSSNIGTAKMAMAMGDGGLKQFYKNLGFFEPVPVDLPERGSPLYPRPWRDINTMTPSYGHGVAVTPLHLVRATAALVNGGVLVEPKILKDRARKSSLIPKPEGERVIRPQTSLQVRKLMELVVAGGTGKKAAVEGYNIGGKTGTAEKNKNGRYDKSALLSSFIGVFPMEEPRYVVLAMLDEPKGTEDTQGYATGGWTGAPVVARVVEQMAPLYHIPPAPDTQAAIVKEMSVYLRDSHLAKGGDFASVGTDR